MEEWETFKDSGKVEDTIRFDPVQKIIYVLKVSGAHTSIAASFNHPFLTVSIPRSIANYWIESSEAGIRGLMEIPGVPSMPILVEKDFQCIKERGEDESKLFPHPDRLAH